MIVLKKGAKTMPVNDYFKCYSNAFRTQNKVQYIQDGSKQPTLKANLFLCYINVFWLLIFNGSIFEGESYSMLNKGYNNNLKLKNLKNFKDKGKYYITSTLE